MKGDGKDTLWLFFGVIILFGIMAAFSPGSMFGKAFISLRHNVENAFGGGVGYCPFINPYAMSIYSAGELVITGDHPLCSPLKKALADVEFTSGSTDCTQGGYVCGDALAGDAKGGPCGSETYTIKILDSTAQKDYTYNFQPDTNYVSVSSGGSEELLSADILFQKLSQIQQDTGLSGSNKVAVQLLTEKRPPWQCFFIFGLLPFFITYYLLNDILAFAYLRTNTRRLIAIFAALIAILTGSFANIIVAISSFVGLSVGQSFLMAIFSLAIVSVLLGQLTVTAGVAQTTVNAVQNAVTGALALKNISGALENKKKDG